MCGPHFPSQPRLSSGKPHPGPPTQQPGERQSYGHVRQLQVRGRARSRVSPSPVPSRTPSSGTCTQPGQQGREVPGHRLRHGCGGRAPWLSMDQPQARASRGDGPNPCWGIQGPLRPCYRGPNASGPSDLSPSHTVTAPSTVTLSSGEQTHRPHRSTPCTGFCPQSPGTVPTGSQTFWGSPPAQPPCAARAACQHPVPLLLPARAIQSLTPAPVQAADKSQTRVDCQVVRTRAAEGLH